MLERLHSYALLAPLSEDTVRDRREATYRDESGVERRVWLDIVATGDSMTPEMSERFTEDAEAASRLKHEHVVPLIDHGIDAGFAYTVSELAESSSLADLIAESPEGRLDPELVALIGVDVTGALAAAHGRRPALVHGALSPSAIHVHADGHVRIQRWAAGALWRSIAVSGGTAGDQTAYLSPEIVQERPLTKRTDLFSLGSTLYEALLGRPAFDAPTPLATGIKIRIGTYERLDVVAPELPAALRQMIARLLDADPAKRPAPASVRNALSTLVHDKKALRASLAAPFAPPPAELPPSPSPVFDPDEELDSSMDMIAYTDPGTPAAFDDATALDSSLSALSPQGDVATPALSLDALSERLEEDAPVMYATAEPTVAEHPIAEDTHEHVLTEPTDAPSDPSLPKTELIALPEHEDRRRTAPMQVPVPADMPRPTPLRPPPPTPLAADEPLADNGPENEWPVAKLAGLAVIAIGLVLVTALFAAWFAG